MSIFFLCCLLLYAYNQERYEMEDIVMTRKLGLLKPDRKTVYLERGKGQKVDYLQISKDLTLNALKKDVKAGALHFKECMEFAEKKPSRVVLIECENEEEGHKKFARRCPTP